MTFEGILKSSKLPLNAVQSVQQQIKITKTMTHQSEQSYSDIN